MKIRLLVIFLVFQLFTLELIAQESLETVSINSPADTLRTDSLKVVEDAPLDIGQNRGLFIMAPDKKMQLRILGSIRSLVVYDNVDLFSKESFVTSEIPTGDDHKFFPNYFNNLSQTRFGFEVTRKTEYGNLFVRLETDFAGVGGFRIRHAYGQYRGFLIGQTWSLFAQISVLPTTVTLSGPTSSISTRTPQIRYTFNVQKKSNFAISLEYQVQDIRLPDSLNASTFPLLPNMTGRFSRNFNWGLLQVSGVLPVLSGFDGNDDLVVKLGWGVSIGALIKPWENGSWHFQLAAGESISRFLGSIDADVNLILTPDGKGELPLELGYYATYQHTWSKKLFSNFVYGAVQLEEFSFTPDDTFIWGASWHLNTFYSPVEGAKVGIEGIYGQRKDHDNTNGNAFRFNMIFYYDF